MTFSVFRKIEENSCYPGIHDILGAPSTVIDFVCLGFVVVFCFVLGLFVCCFWFFGGGGGGGGGGVGPYEYHMDLYNELCLASQLADLRGKIFNIGHYTDTNGSTKFIHTCHT